MVCRKNEKDKSEKILKDFNFSSQYCSFGSISGIFYPCSNGEKTWLPGRSQSINRVWELG